MSSNNNSGFGAIEVLMTLLLCTLLLSGFIHVAWNKTSNTYLDSKLAKLQLKERYMTTLITRALRLASFEYPSELKEDYIYTSIPELLPISSEWVKGLNTVNGSDALILRYIAKKDNNFFSCMLTPPIADQMMQSLFFINEHSELACCPIEDEIPNFNKADILVKGVERMRILYAEEDNEGRINRFWSADSPNFDYRHINTIKISLLLRTPQKASVLSDNKYYTLQDIEVGPFNDHYVRKVYTKTVSLKGLPVQ